MRVSTSQVHNLISELEEEYPDSLLYVKDMKHDERIKYIAKLEMIEYTILFFSSDKNIFFGIGCFNTCIQFKSDK